jgi:hypothetical protein
MEFIKRFGTDVPRRGSKKFASSNISRLDQTDASIGDVWRLYPVSVKKAPERRKRTCIASSSSKPIIVAWIEQRGFQSSVEALAKYLLHLAQFSLCLRNTITLVVEEIGYGSLPIDRGERRPEGQ